MIKTGERIVKYYTAAAMAKRLVILNAKRERIRNTLRGKTDCRAPCGARNDKERMNRRGIKEPQIKKAKYDLKIDYI